MRITNERGNTMQFHFYDDVVQRTSPIENVDDLIFLTFPDWLVSDR